MKLNAYILAADPAWIEASVQSYYSFVDRIVVSYDDRKKSWTGTPLPVDECLQRLRAIDSEGKFVYSPGCYARPEFEPLENDTYQRQCALDEAGRDADWVLQLDTDERIAAPAVFLSCLEQAGAEGFDALDYPARWLYQQVGDHRFLELRDRLWRPKSFSPGPVAVRAGTVLKNARQTDARAFYVEFTKPKAGGGIHRLIPKSQAILHYSWVRTEDELRRKFSSWGHSKERNWSREIDRWVWCKRHPYLAVVNCPLVRGSFVKYVGMVTVK